jgi:hypothetical protein
MKGLNLDGFKKIHSDAKITTLKHPAGHEIKVLHSALHPEMRKQLAALPIEKMADGGKFEETHFSSKKGEKHAKTMNAAATKQFPKKFQEGGTADDVAEPNAQNAAAMQSGATSSGTPTFSDVAKNIKAGLSGPAPKTDTAVSDPGVKTSTDPNTKNDLGAEIPGTKRTHQSSNYAQGGKAVQYAKGTEDAPVSDDSSPDSDNDIPSGGPNDKPPVVINVGATPAANAPAPFPGPGPQGTSGPGAAQGAASSTPDLDAAPSEGQGGGDNSAQASPGVVAPSGQANGAGGATPNDPYGATATQKAYLQGLGEQKAGLAQQYAGESALGTAQATSLNKAAAMQQQNIANFQSHYNTLDQARQHFQQAIEQQNIDPNKYISGMSTGGKIATALGLIAGGLGAGLTKGPNFAMDFLNKQISNDIDAQRANLGKTSTLLSKNMEQFGNMRDAQEMTRIQQQDLIKTAMERNAAEQTDPMAKARLLQATGIVDKDSADKMGQMAMRRTLLSGAQNGTIPPEQFIRGVVPEGQQAEALKQLKDAQDAVSLRDNTLNAFDQIAQINTAGNRVMNPIQSKAQIDAIRGAALDKLTKDTSGRVTPQTIELISGMLSPGVTHNEKTRGIEKSRLNAVLTQGMHYPVLAQWGLHPEQNGTHNRAGQTTIPESAPVRPNQE